MYVDFYYRCFLFVGWRHFFHYPKVCLVHHHHQRPFILSMFCFFALFLVSSLGYICVISESTTNNDKKKVRQSGRKNKILVKWIKNTDKHKHTHRQWKTETMRFLCLLHTQKNRPRYRNRPKKIEKNLKWSLKNSINIHYNQANSKLILR